MPWVSHGVGRHRTGTRILAITDEATITVVHLTIGEILSEHNIDTHPRLQE